MFLEMWVGWQIVENHILVDLEAKPKRSVIGTDVRERERNSKCEFLTWSDRAELSET